MWAQLCIEASTQKLIFETRIYGKVLSFKRFSTTARFSSDQIANLRLLKIPEGTGIQYVLVSNWTSDPTKSDNFDTVSNRVPVVQHC
jgi:hypothetical protein